MTDEHKQKIKEATEANIAAINAGEISFAEFHRRAHEIQRRAFLPLLIEHKNNKNWEEFIKTATCIFELMPDAFLYYDQVPDSLKAEFAIGAYMHHGDSIPAVRKAIRGLKRYYAAEIPEELEALEEITVYRAGEEEPNKARYRISWTTDKERAYFFLNQWRGRHAKYLYQGKIKPKDIIAYTDDMNEKEVMQYGKVYDIKIIDTATECR